MNKKQRRGHYKFAIERIINNLSESDNYICNILSLSSEQDELLFEEFQMFRPIKNRFIGMAWFHESSDLGIAPTKEEICEANILRIQCLMFCIEMTKP